MITPSNLKQPRLIAGIFLVVAGILGAIYLFFAALSLIDLVTSRQGVLPIILATSLLPAALGYYLLYGYFCIFFSYKFIGTPMITWMLTLGLNFAGVLYIPHLDWQPDFPFLLRLLYHAQIWPIAATLLSGIAICQLIPMDDRCTSGNSND